MWPQTWSATDGLGWFVTHATVCRITFRYNQLILRRLQSDHSTHTRTQKQQNFLEMHNAVVLRA